MTYLLKFTGKIAFFLSIVVLFSGCLDSIFPGISGDNTTTEELKWAEGTASPDFDTVISEGNVEMTIPASSVAEETPFEVYVYSEADFTYYLDGILSIEYTESVVEFLGGIELYIEYFEDEISLDFDVSEFELDQGATYKAICFLLDVSSYEILGQLYKLDGSLDSSNKLVAIDIPASIFYEEYYKSDLLQLKYSEADGIEATDAESYEYSYSLFLGLYKFKSTSTEDDLVISHGEEQYTLDALSEPGFSTAVETDSISDQDYETYEDEAESSQTSETSEDRSDELNSREAEDADTESQDVRPARQRPETEDESDSERPALDEQSRPDLDSEDRPPRRRPTREDL
ncbi:MAG: hypothetical protein ABIA04_11640 [Pseudomonadota bacterium]